MDEAVSITQSRMNEFKASSAIRRRNRVWALRALLALIFMASLVSLTIGPMSLSLQKVSLIVLEKFHLASTADLCTDAERIVVWNIRFTRTLLAVLIGGGLAMAGASMQGVFRNPLADPGVIGVSGGGAIGAIAMIVLGMRYLPPGLTSQFSLYLVPLAAMAGAILMTLLIYHLSLRRGQVDLISMLLVGIAINAIGGAFIGLVSAFIATAEELQTVTFWTMGSLNRATWDLIISAAIFVVLPMVILPRYSRALNALALGEEDAAHLGIDVRKTKRGLIALSASLIGATVALCGMIGFIALVAPHIVRTALGADHRFLLPASALLGAALLLLADMVSRTIVAPAELPIGILTGLFGAPVFLSLIIKRNRRC
ncbi:MAG: iron ABC transporter permease [Puniceicoccales bacterium]|jgi:iron complex transport system permease protein|nr:iron ABC transporter permease [Puniceicoccales bacterium]